MAKKRRKPAAKRRAPKQDAPTGFAFRDYGPVAEAWIEPAALTVLVGPSGSGKSFVATAMYAYASAGKEFLDAIAEPSRLLGHGEAIEAAIHDLAGRFEVAIADHGEEGFATSA